MLSVLSFSSTNSSSLAGMPVIPELRKATTQMRIAHVAAAQCLSGISKDLISNREEVGLIVGTSQGELETTKEYYRFWAQQKMARPFLFQNSLHHSTAGFLSQTLNILGPTLTFSDRFFSGEAAIDAAWMLLNEGNCKYCLVVGVDTIVPGLDIGVRTLYPSGLIRGEGAGALLLTTKKNAADLEWQELAQPKIHLSSWQINKIPSREPVNLPELAAFYDSNAVELLGKNAGKQGELIFRKPDGRSSVFFIE